MFSNHKSTKSNSIVTKTDEGYVIFSHYHNLPNKKVLFISQDFHRTKTRLKIFSTADLTTCLAETFLPAEWSLLCIFPDSSLLLTKWASTRNELIRLCPLTLGRLTSQIWDSVDSARVAAIDNENFCTIRPETGYWSNRGKRHCLSIHTLEDGSYVKSHPFQLSAYPVGGGTMSHLESLGENRFCCDIRGYLSHEFKILIFDINLDTQEIRELGIILPEAQYVGGSTAASGSFLVLPNGNILSYHECHNEVQVWDTKTFNCIQSWKWSDVIDSDSFCLKLKAFADGIHLLVHKEYELFLFNMKKLELHKIEMPCKVAYHARHHILPNGQIIAFNHPQHPSLDSVSTVQFEVKEIKAAHEKYCKILTESQHLVRLFFRNYFPLEITNHIFSHAFTPEAKKQLQLQLANSEDVPQEMTPPQKSRCHIM